MIGIFLLLIGSLEKETLNGVSGQKTLKFLLRGAEKILEELEIDELDANNQTQRHARGFLSHVCETQPLDDRRT